MRQRAPVQWLKGWASMRVRIAAGLLLALGSTATAPLLAQTQAQGQSNEWQFRALLYLYLPQIGGSQTFPTGTSADITIDPNQILKNLNFAFMGAFEAQQGIWGLYTDILYVDVSDSKSSTRALSIGGVTIPSNVSAYANLGVKTTMWTLGGSYRLLANADSTLDFVAGFRTLFLEQRLNYSFSADVGPFVGPLRQGSSKVSPTDWDGIIGIKGRLIWGERHSWFAPFYVDIGTGQSEFTWQGIAGVGYAFNWGEVLGVWRYVDYQFDHGSRLSMNGPALGVAFRW
jgi:hypothetical protein